MPYNRDSWKVPPPPPPSVDAWELYKRASDETARLVPFKQEVPWSVVLIIVSAIGWVCAISAFRDSVSRSCPAYRYNDAIASDPGDKNVRVGGH